MNARDALIVGTYALSNMIMYDLLIKHYHGTCSSSWLSVFLTEPSAYCQLVRRGLDILQWAPLVAVGLAVGPIAGVQLLPRA